MNSTKFEDGDSYRFSGWLCKGPAARMECGEYVTGLEYGLDHKQVVDAIAEPLRAQLAAVTKERDELREIAEIAYQGLGALWYTKPECHCDKCVAMRRLKQYLDAPLTAAALQPGDSA